ncbi:hypothetical protein B5566_02540 [Mycobacterium sp. MHSD3]|nr:hypothetical protein B5566_02540 [Mycobacterium sp. MHSD3]
MKRIPGPPTDDEDTFAVFHYAAMTLGELRKFVNMSSQLPAHTSVFAHVHEPTESLIAIRTGGVKE